MAEAQETTGAVGNPVRCPAHSGVIAVLRQQEQRFAAGNRRMERIEETIAEIRNGLLSRPSWPVALILTALSTITAALIVGIVVASLK